jgi:hypothetical protein
MVHSFSLGEYCAGFAGVIPRGFEGDYLRDVPVVKDWTNTVTNLIDKHELRFRRTLLLIDTIHESLKAFKETLAPLKGSPVLFDNINFHDLADKE